MATISAPKVRADTPAYSADYIANLINDSISVHEQNYRSADLSRAGWDRLYELAEHVISEGFSRENSEATHTYLKRAVTEAFSRLVHEESLNTHYWF